MTIRKYPKDALLRLSPFHDSDNFEVTGAIDRHGIDFAIRGMDELINQTETKALNQKFDSGNW